MALTPAPSITSAITSAHDSAFAIVSAHASAFDLASASDRALDRASDLDSASDRNRAFDIARDLARKLGLTEFENEIRNLQLPPDTATSAEWQMFANNLQKLMVKHRNIGHDWKFTNEDRQALENYKRATVLLAECLQLAAVSSPEVRKKIEKSLFMPPGEWEAW